jgi:hypothetical protein
MRPERESPEGIELMKTALTIVVSLIIGAVLGGFLALGVGAGLGAGSGIIVGSQAGACLLAETAKEKGLLSEQQIDEVIAATVAKIRGKTEGAESPEVQWVGSEADCARMIAELERGAAPSQ